MRGGQGHHEWTGPGQPSGAIGVAAYRVPEIVVNVAAPEVTVEAAPAPNVTVNVPDFPVIPAPIVNVPAPEIPAPVVIIPEAKASPVQDVRIVDDVSPPKVKRVIRGRPTKANPDGPIEGMVEGHQ
jgi:hypothetical protein